MSDRGGSGLYIVSISEFCNKSAIVLISYLSEFGVALSSVVYIIIYPSNTKRYSSL